MKDTLLKEEAKKQDMKPIHKFNNGTGATLCHECRIIIEEDLTDAIYCDDCKPDMTQRGETILGK